MTQTEVLHEQGLECLPKGGSHVRYRFFHFYHGTPHVLPPGSGWAPPMDLYETEDEVVLEVNLSGIDPDEVQVRFESNRLIISGQRNESRETSMRCYHVMEIERGSFARTIELPSPVDARTTRAVSEHGLLIVRVAKQPGGQTHGCYPADSMEGFE
jgi:HSP20 family molecular chaperone IbpA